MTHEQILTIHERLDEVMEYISVHHMTGDWHVAAGNSMHDALMELRYTLPTRPDTGWMLRGRKSRHVYGVYKHYQDAVTEWGLMLRQPFACECEVVEGIETDEGWKERYQPKPKPAKADDDDTVVWGHA